MLSLEIHRRYIYSIENKKNIIKLFRILSVFNQKKNCAKNFCVRINIKGHFRTFLKLSRRGICWETTIYFESLPQMSAFFRWIWPQFRPQRRGNFIVWERCTVMCRVIKKFFLPFQKWRLRSISFPFPLSFSALPTEQLKVMPVFALLHSFELYVIFFYKNDGLQSKHLARQDLFT